MWSISGSVLIRNPKNISKIKPGVVKILAFDLDGTIIDSRMVIYGAKNSWKLRFPFTGLVMKIFMEGWSIVIFSNQKNLLRSSVRTAMFKSRIENVLRTLDVDIFVFAATADDNYRKPNVGMLQEYLKFNDIESYGGWYVGDACGASCETQGYRWSDCDSKFAANTKLKYKHPEEVLAVKTE